ncbi:MAG TPA: peptidoglycan DD-metalloendopeptidase family protein [Candidatus Paceibacterota bacterium]|nr:peptidoglycan DD-metalloendopeptidase family protein [Candidatus Paceibacterota bacterium]
MVLLFRFAYLPQNGAIVEKGVLGGPSVNPTTFSNPLVSTAQAENANMSNAVVTDEGALRDQGFSMLSSDLSATGQTSGPILSADFLSSGAIQDPGQPIGPAVNRSGLVSYKVQSGDNLSRIASYFGINVQTILDANPGVKAATLKAGQVLSILPTSGVVYEAKADDTLATIATTFDISQDKIAQFNQGVNFNTLSAGQSIIIPGGTNAALGSADSGGLPNFDKNFVMPATGYNWGILHHENAVDIANSCGTPVVAAASGIVIPDPAIPDAPDAWNDGYGNFVLIEHAFGSNVETRYAHLEKIIVQIGDYVNQGQEIGLMGQTGDATGCHVHFEVLGAHNPFAKK